MKKLIVFTIILLTSVHFNIYAQEQYGKTLNLGLGVAGYSGYYRYAGSIPVINANYEIDIVKDFTLAPFASIYSFKDKYYWGNNNNPDRFYSYSEIVIPVGIKGYYYFDDLLDLNGDWDIYAASSLGIAIVNSTWESGYLGERDRYHRGSSVFLDLHIGASYHFSHRFGAYLDLSSGVSTIGVQIQGKN